MKNQNDIQTRFALCLLAAVSIVGRYRAFAPAGCDPQNSQVSSGPVDLRDMRDAAIEKSVAMPTSAGTSTSAGVDLQSNGANVRRNAELVIEAPLHASGVDTKTHTYTIEESDDDVTYAASANYAATVNTATASGFPAFEKRFPLFPTTKRYVRMVIVGNSGSGNTSSKNASIGLRF